MTWISQLQALRDWIAVRNNRNPKFFLTLDDISSPAGGQWPPSKISPDQLLRPTPVEKQLVKRRLFPARWLRHAVLPLTSPLHVAAADNLPEAGEKPTPWHQIIARFTGGCLLHGWLPANSRCFLAGSVMGQRGDIFLWWLWLIHDLLPAPCSCL